MKRLALTLWFRLRAPLLDGDNWVAFLFVFVLFGISAGWFGE